MDALNQLGVQYGGHSSEEEQEDTKMSPTKKHAKACDVCRSNTAKYRCPRCELRSCSLDCSKRHKLETGCSGERDRTAFVPITEFTDEHLVSDFRLLEDVNRVADIAKRERSRKGLHNSKQLPSRLKFLTREAKRQAIKLIFMPMGMSRREHNTTHYDDKLKQIVWHVEFIFKHCQVTRHLEAVSTSCLSEVLSSLLDPHTGNTAARQQLLPYSKEPRENLLIYTQTQNVPANQKRFEPVELHKTVGECLNNKTVIEYPTFYVALPIERDIYTSTATSSDHSRDHIKMEDGSSSSDESDAESDSENVQKPNTSQHMEQAVLLNGNHNGDGNGSLQVNGFHSVDITDVKVEPSDDR
eukprot:GILK01009404.1.p1 GENE.GILK01009404.1~~GILK01009404.1.p1  ORF type:complete len:366 (+),score=56.95 GILK01009404.1:36-1100(+)